MTNSCDPVPDRPSALVVRLALPLAWLLLASAPARAGYCSLASQDPLWRASGTAPLLFGAAGWETGSTGDNLAVIEPAPPPRSSAPQPPVDFRLASLHQQLPFDQQTGDCETSSPPRIGTGTASKPKGVFDKPELPPDERGHRLGLEINSWDLPSFPSRLFRPPRQGA